MILVNFMFIYLNLCSTKGVFRVELYDLGKGFSHFQKVYHKSEFQLVFGQFSISTWSEKGPEPSRAEPKIPQLELWLEPARLGLVGMYLFANFYLEMPLEF